MAVKGGYKEIRKFTIFGHKILILHEHYVQNQSWIWKLEVKRNLQDILILFLAFKNE